MSPVGRTRDAGWEIGVSRTVARTPEQVWRTLTSTKGVATWLGAGVRFPAEKGDRYETADGTTGEVRSFRPLDRIRLTWQSADRPHPSTVQVAITPARAGRGGTTVRFHQERLASAAERERQRTHWREVLDALFPG